MRRRDPAESEKQTAELLLESWRKLAHSKQRLDESARCLSYPSFRKLYALRRTRIDKSDPSSSFSTNFPLRSTRALIRDYGSRVCVLRFGILCGAHRGFVQL